MSYAAQSNRDAANHPPNPTMIEGSLEKRARQTDPEKNTVQSRAPRNSSSTKGNGHQDIPILQAWRSIFARSRSAKSKSTSKSRLKQTSQKQPPESGHRMSDKTPNPSQPDADSLASASSSLVARLGKAELGRYAHEDSMPRSLRALLNGRGESCNSGIIGVLSRLLKVDPSTKAAYLCDPRVQHVAKMRREGSFCGYRNLQMLISYIINAKAPGSHLFPDVYPTIFQLQDLIENAWDHGHNAHGRLETGGIKGTRKFIGTPEAQALFAGLGIKASVQAFRNAEPGQAATLMLDSVYEYFRQKSDVEKDQRVQRTRAAPIYFQHQGHSMTIVGAESRQDGGKALIVFDPAHRDASIIKALVGTSQRRLPTTSSRLLRPYRCTFRYLSKYKEFELLFLEPVPIV